jgi:hypothetical protein
MADYDLLREIDETIDHLIENAMALESIAMESSGYELEKTLLEQTQESLLAHLLDLDQKYSKKSSSPHVDVKKIKSFSLDELDKLPSCTKLKNPKIKLGKKRLKSNILKVS